MYHRFSLLVTILLLFSATFQCFPNVLYPSTSGTSLSITVAYNTTTSPLYYTTISNTSTISTFDKPSGIESPISNGSSLLDLISLAHGSQKTISGLKCEEYEEEIMNITETPYISKDNNREYLLFNRCGRLKSQLFDIRVVDGTIAYLGEYPHMVALGKHNSDGNFILVCGGTLISHTWVLSAAHCTHGTNGDLSEARMGMDRLTDQHNGITISVKNMVRHPDYNPPAMYADIALMELAASVTFSLAIYPACLHQQYDIEFLFSTVTGWGVTEIDGEQSDYLQKAHLLLVDNLRCKVQYNVSKEIPNGITSSMICANGDEKDACRGDSGGPLQIQENFCVHRIIGITSFGRSCGLRNSPGVYTRVSHYIPWIESIVWPQLE